MIQKQITITKDQLNWLEKNHICLSKLVRSYLDDAMKSYKEALRIIREAEENSTKTEERNTKEPKS